MKKILLLKIILLNGIIAHSQTLDFTLANPQPNLMEVYAGTFASGDVDGDGDKDLFMTGITPGKFTKLYLNNGTGNFTETTATTFPRSGSSRAILKDLDGDTDLDLFFSGNNELNQNFTNIYRNNGTGVFTQVVNSALPTAFVGADIADVDNDGDQDIVLSGQINTTSLVAGVYLNNGNAVFSAQGSTIFTAVKFSTVAFIDIENDGDKDVIISGDDLSNVGSIKLYQNNGLGIFTVNTNSIIAALNGGDIDVADTDNDGDLDFLINGNTQNIIYTNNGSGVFTPITTALQQTQAGKNAIADLDNDGDQDILIVGSQAGGLPNIFNIVYQNTGNNVFVQTEILGGEYLADCIIDDFTGDGLKDIIIQGFANRTNVYWNTSTVLSVTDSIISSQEVNYFPNPAKDIVTFSSKNIIENITIFNLLGQEVLSKQVNSEDLSIDISNLSSGTYIAKLKNNGKIQTVKLVKI